MDDLLIRYILCCIVRFNVAINTHLLDNYPCLREVDAIKIEFKSFQSIWFLSIRFRATEMPDSSIVELAKKFLFHADASGCRWDSNLDEKEMFVNLSHERVSCTKLFRAAIFFYFRKPNIECKFVEETSRTWLYLKSAKHFLEGLSSAGFDSKLFYVEPAKYLHLFVEKTFFRLEVGQTCVVDLHSAINFLLFRSLKLAESVANNFSSRCCWFNFNWNVCQTRACSNRFPESISQSLCAAFLHLHRKLMFV